MSTLKELTAEKHKEAESQPFIKSIFAGEVDKAKYIDYLYQLLCVYKKLEQYGDELGLFSGMEGIKRYSAMEDDYVALLEKPPYPLIRKSTDEYVSYLKEISNDADKIMAHIYVRHMGDLFGGQMLAKLLPGPNSMFRFENMPQLINTFRSKLNVSMADEANTAFQYNINILKEYD